VPRGARAAPPGPAAAPGVVLLVVRAAVATSSGSGLTAASADTASPASLAGFSCTMFVSWSLNLCATRYLRRVHALFLQEIE
jgi:hypothetical protein